MVVLPGFAQLLVGGILFTQGRQGDGGVAAACRIRGARLGAERQIAHGIGILDAVVPAIAEHLADVDRADHAERLDAAILDGGIGAVAGTGADAHGPDPVLIDIGQRGQVVHHGADVLGADVGILQLARLARALALIGAVKGDGDEALAGVQARGLLLHPAAGVGNHNRRVLLALIEVRREVNDGGHSDALAVAIGEGDVGHGRALR